MATSLAQKLEFDGEAPVTVTTPSRKEALARMNAGEAAVHEHITDPRIYSAASSLIEGHRRGRKVDIEAHDYPYNVLENVAQQLHDIGASHQVTENVLGALEEYIINLGSDFSREAKAKPLYARIAVVNQLPDDMPECEQTQATMIDGLRKIGGEAARVNVQSTLYGTKSTTSQGVDLGAMFSSKTDGLFVFFGSPGNIGIGGFDSVDNALVNLAQGMAADVGGGGGSVSKAEIEDIKSAIQNGEAPAAMIQQIESLATLQQMVEAAKTPGALENPQAQIAAQVATVAQQVQQSVESGTAVPALVTASMNALTSIARNDALAVNVPQSTLQAIAPKNDNATAPAAAVPAQAAPVTPVASAPAAQQQAPQAAPQQQTSTQPAQPQVSVAAATPMAPVVSTPSTAQATPVTSAPAPANPVASTPVAATPAQVAPSAPAERATAPRASESAAPAAPVSQAVKSEVSSVAAIPAARMTTPIASTPVTPSVAPAVVASAVTPGTPVSAPTIKTESVAPVAKETSAPAVAPTSRTETSAPAEVTRAPVNTPTPTVTTKAPMPNPAPTPNPAPGNPTVTPRAEVNPRPVQPSASATSTPKGNDGTPSRANDSSRTPTPVTSGISNRGTTGAGPVQDGTKGGTPAQAPRSQPSSGVKPTPAPIPARAPTPPPAAAQTKPGTAPAGAGNGQTPGGARGVQQQNRPQGGGPAKPIPTTAGQKGNPAPRPQPAPQPQKAGVTKPQPAPQPAPPPRTQPQPVKQDNALPRNPANPPVDHRRSFKEAQRPPEKTADRPPPAPRPAEPVHTPHKEDNYVTPRHEVNHTQFTNPGTNNTSWSAADTKTYTASPTTAPISFGGGGNGGGSNVFDFSFSKDAGGSKSLFGSTNATDGKIKDPFSKCAGCGGGGACCGTAAKVQSSGPKQKLG